MTFLNFSNYDINEYLHIIYIRILINYITFEEGIKEYFEGKIKVRNL